MSFIKRFFEKRALKKSLKAHMKELDEEETSSVMLPLAPPMPPMDERPAVTGVYETVKLQISKAIQEKHKTTEAARRVSNTIGATPTPMPRTAKK